MMSVQTCTPMAKTLSDQCKECQAPRQCKVACQLRQCDGQALNKMKECQALNQMKEGQVACQLRQCDDNEFHVTFELRTDGVFITNIPYNNITPRIVTPAKLLQINHENVECDMTRFREMMTTLKQNKVNNLVVDGEIKSCLKRKQHSGRRTSKRKRLESHHVNFDLTKNQTKIVDRYIMSEERAKHILRQVLKERMRAAILIQRAVRRYLSTHVHANERKQAANLIQRAVRRWLKNAELRVMLNSDRHSLQTFYNVGFTDAEMSRYVAYHSSGRPMQYRGRPIAIHAPSKFATRIQSVVRGFLGRCAQTRKVDESLGIEAVLKVMKAYPRDIRVQREACEVLANLTHNAVKLVKIVKAGGIEVILAAMQAHPDVENVQQDGWLILHTFDFAIRIQTAMRRYLAKKKYLACGEQMHKAISAQNKTHMALTAMLQTREEATPSLPLESINACMDAYRQYKHNEYLNMMKFQDIRDDLVRRFPRLLENMVSEEDIKVFDTVKHLPVLRWFAQMGGIDIDYTKNIPLATLYDRFEDRDVQSYLHGPRRLREPILTKKQFKLLLATMKSVTLSSPSVNCTVYFNLMHVQQEVTSLARRLDRSLYCFANVLPLHRQNDSLYPVKKVYKYDTKPNGDEPNGDVLRQKVDTTKVHKYGAEPNGDVLRQKVGNPYAIVPLEDGDRNMFIDDQGKRKKRPINEYATKLAGFPIYGDVAVAANKKRKLNVKMERKTM